MATVYLAHDEDLDRPVAVKVLAAHLTSEPGFYERFVREARMAARLSHPNVVQVFNAGEEDRRPYIVMEYVPGHTLSDELHAQGRLDAARVVDLSLQVCGGLEAAHASGLIHRDVKPQNLLLRPDGTVKITDFGIARAAEATNLTQIGSVLGTAAYLSPEQSAGEPVTAAADIYSLGVVLYELLTGQKPYTFASLEELVVKQRERPIPPLREVEADIPEELEAVVMRCLARNPEYRPASAAELARDLAAASPEPPTVDLPQASGVRATEIATVPLAEPRAPGPRRARRRLCGARRGGPLGECSSRSASWRRSWPSSSRWPSPAPETTAPSRVARSSPSPRSPTQPSRRAASRSGSATTRVRRSRRDRPARTLAQTRREARLRGAA
jgi:serine/threonine protein kinase